MNYLKHYNLLIDMAKNRVLDGYVERHHIIPKCIGGSNNISNLVQLTPEEHYVAHQLLCKIYPNIKGLAFAVVLMTGNPYGKINNKLYGWTRARAAIAGSFLSKQKWANPEYRIKHKAAMDDVRSRPEYGENLSRAMKGKVVSVQARANISEARKKAKPRRFSDKAKENMAKARHKNWEERKLSGEDKVIAQKVRATRILNGSYNFSDEHKANISKALKAKAKSTEHIKAIVDSNKFKRRNHLSEEHKQKIREANIGRTFSEESLEKMRRAQKGRKPSQLPVKFGLNKEPENFTAKIKN